MSMNKIPAADGGPSFLLFSAEILGRREGDR
jgi:hypothetical protein